MHIQPDFEELLRLLEKHDIEYMVVGGYAVAFHGFPRFTKDIDIFYNDSTDNIRKLKKALIAFGFTPQELTEDLLCEKGTIITFGIEPTRVDMMNEIDGIQFQTSWNNRTRGKYGSIEVNFIGKSDLIRNIQSTSRLLDKADAEELS